MANVKLPAENANEPAEEAHQPVCVSDSTMSSQEKANKPKNRHATFSEDLVTTEKELSQNSSAYKEALSQPAPGLSHRQRLAWLQRRRGPGLWAQCDACNVWRHLPHVVDSHQLPPKWYCSMNPDKSMGDCSAPEAALRITEEEDLIHSEYSAGSLVWARLPGWPWWPAMVDDCPDTEQFYWLDGFSDIPTHYNVVFFDATETTRAWITPENLKPYTANKKKFRHLMNTKQYKKRLEKATQQADTAEKLPVADRLTKFSFISTFRGPIMSPKKVDKSDLERYQNKLKRKFNVDFPMENTSESESEDESLQAFRESNKRKNVILIGTPKSKKVKQSFVIDKKSDNAIVTKTHRGNNKRRVQQKSKQKANSNGFHEVSYIDEQETSTKKFNKNPRIMNDDIKRPEESSLDVNVTKNTSSCVANTVTTVTSESEQCFKRPDSMDNEIGSTQNLNSEINGIDNDSSKTYVPDSSDPVVFTQDFQIRASTPSSDDFDF